MKCVLFLTITSPYDYLHQCFWREKLWNVFMVNVKNPPARPTTIPFTLGNPTWIKFPYVKIQKKHLMVKKVLPPYNAATGAGFLERGKVDAAPPH